MEKLDVTKKTKSFTYVLPILGNRILSFKSSIVNAFIGDEDYPHLDNHIFVLYKFHGSPEFLKFENDLEDSEPLFVKSYDPEAKYVMKVFKVPVDDQEDYDLLRQSKFSKISMKMKTRIIAFHNLPSDHPITDVLFKREAAFARIEKTLSEGVSPVTIDRNLEASGLLDETRETYNSKYKTEDPFKKYRERFLEEGED